MEIRAKLADLADSCLQPGQFLVDVIASSKNLSKITIVVDGDQGVSIDDCGEISRQLAGKLDGMDFGSGRYVLEVTTPGLDQPLKLKRQYAKNVGRSLKVRRRDQSQITGKLSQANDAGIVLLQEIQEGKVRREQEVPVSYENIDKAFVIVSFK